MEIGRPLILFRGHHHPLIFLENDEGGRSSVCAACNTSCSSSMFHCLTCNFNLHLLCGPLPCTVREVTYRHTLFLKDSHVDEWEEDEPFCDCCEEIRNPRECVYYCEHTSGSFCAEIKCVMPELVLALTGKCGDVELRTLGRWGLRGKVDSSGSLAEEMQKNGGQAGEPPLLIEAIYQSLGEDEKTELESLFSSSSNLFDHFSEDGDSEAAFVQLMGRFEKEEYKNFWLTECTKLSSFQVSSGADPSFRLTRVGDLMVAEKFVPILNDLDRKYGDISAGSPLSPSLKAIVFFYLCLSLDGMSRTKVIDITDDVIAKWCTALEAAHRARFKVQFGLDVLKRGLLAHCGLKALESQANRQKKIELGHKEIWELKAKLAELRDKRNQHIASTKSASPALVEDCLREASELKYKHAGDVLLGYQFKIYRLRV